jgi:DNA replication licensing factor MCM4
MGLDGSTRGGAGEDRRGVVGVGMEEEQPAGELEDEILAQEEEEFGASDANTQARLKEKLVEISRRDDIYEYLSRSLAPSIFEMDDVKKGILLQLFGGTNKSLTKGGGAGGPRYRGDINVLLVGDPGTSKSQILQVSLISSRILFNSH